MKLNISYAITLFLFILPIVLSVENNGFRVELRHVDSKGNFTQSELLYRAAARTMNRLSQIRGRQLFSSANIISTMRGGSKETPLGTYYMDLAIGTPPLFYSLIVDTATDLIWTQCTPCKKCVFQPTPIYNPSRSTTVSPIPCNSPIYEYLCSVDPPPPSCLCSYNYTYVAGWTSGTLKTETFTFGTTKAVQLSETVFGCSTSSSDDFNGTSGLVGFSRGVLSLPSQLNVSMFSYCLTSFFDTNSTSTLFLGHSAKFSGTAVKTTPFVKIPSDSPLSAFYYLSLQGISLGTTKLSVQPSAFTFQSDGTGGFIIDSGTTITNLINPAYHAVQNAINSIVNLRRVNGSNINGLDTCYNVPSGSSLPTMPDMTFHFQGADMVLPVENYMIPNPENNLWCLALFGTDGVSVLGNYQQQNFHILYDVDKDVLSFAPAQCDSL
ncbi:Aspartic proteinase nepenthesin-1 [Carex littledalei]|uniref:Aspartic proteinase nepenthesin-1 n=1 Tax=Carex littledalei TaxID=544730 RepID=A0A833RLP4_9POAL|nr:Aspartic proteinase nepenthesin-1 [Carex littledalei]